MSASVTSMRDALYEAPGPKARRRIAVGTVIALVAVLAGIAAILYQFAVTGQLDPQYWVIFLRPTTWRFFGEGLLGTLEVAVVAGVIALLLGLLFMLGRISHLAWLRGLARIPIELTRGVPTLLFIYFFFLVVPTLGVKMTSFWMIAAPVAVSASGTIAEVLRSGVNAVSKGQVEAALSLGMRRSVVTRKIVLPQAIRFVIPTLISELVIVVKDTTFAYIVSFPDLMQNARVMVTRYDALVSVYLVVAVIYILVNYLINKASVYVARRTDANVLNVTGARVATNRKN